MKVEFIELLTDAEECFKASPASPELVFASATESFATANLNRTVAESPEIFAPVVA